MRVASSSAAAAALAVWMSPHLGRDAGYTRRTTPAATAAAARTINTTQEAAFRYLLAKPPLPSLDARDAAYVVSTLTIENVTLPLGLAFVEEPVFARSGELTSFALIEEALDAGGAHGRGVRPGDALVRVDGASVEGLGVDETLAAVRRAADGRSMLTLTLKRLVPRASITLRVLSPEGAQLGEEIETLAGGNLRMELLRKQIELYDARTKRFDNPWGTGDCAGEGLCGTCLVELKDGGVRCSPRRGEEERLLKTRPVRWRLACRTFIGAENEPGELTVRLRPQSDGGTEWDDGIPDISLS